MSGVALRTRSGRPAELTHLLPASSRRSRMRELDPIRRLAPPVEPLAPDAVARIRARALAPRRRRLPVAGLLVPAAIAATVAVVVVLGGSPDREVPAQAPAAAADGAPRLLLGGGWKVTRVDEWKPGSGEMTFARDRQ